MGQTFVLTPINLSGKLVAFLNVVVRKHSAGEYRISVSKFHVLNTTAKYTLRK